MGAGPGGPSNGHKVGAMAGYPPYSLAAAAAAGRAGPEHLSPYNNVANSPYGRPPLLGYDGHPHSRTPGMATNGLAGMSGGKPYVFVIIISTKKDPVLVLNILVLN